jgi:predicted membrane protein
MVAVTPPDDPILARRRRIARLAELGQRIGYALFGAAIVAFVVAFIVGFRDGWVTFIVAAMILGSVFLAPAIVAGYAVKAADREDRGLPSGH